MAEEKTLTLKAVHTQMIDNLHKGLIEDSSVKQLMKNPKMCESLRYDELKDSDVDMYTNVGLNSILAGLVRLHLIVTAKELLLVSELALLTARCMCHKGIEESEVKKIGDNRKLCEGILILRSLGLRIGRLVSSRQHKIYRV